MYILSSILEGLTALGKKFVLHCLLYTVFCTQITCQLRARTVVRSENVMGTGRRSCTQSGYGNHFCTPKNYQKCSVCLLCFNTNNRQTYN